MSYGIKQTLHRKAVKMVAKALRQDDISCHGVLASQRTIAQVNLMFHNAKLKQLRNNNV